MIGCCAWPRSCASLAAAFVWLAALALSPGAQAFEHGDCVAPADFAATLEDNSQGLVAAMDTMTVNDRGETVYRAEFVTSNGAGRGYLFVADAQLGGNASRFCVTHILRSLGVNDCRVEGPPTVAHFDFDEDEALRQCAEIRERSGNRICGHRASVLEIAEREQGQRLVLHGLFEDESGTARGLFTLIAEPDLPATYRVLTTADRGATAVLENGIRFALSPRVLAFLDQGQP